MKKEREETIVVSALRPLNSMPIKLAYQKGSDIIFINREGILRTMPAEEFSKKMGNKEDALALKVAFLKFKSAKKNRAGELSFSYKVKVDEEGTIIRPDKAIKDQAYGIFFTDCTFAEVDGVESELPSLLSVKYINKTKRVQAIDTKKNLQIATLLQDMGLKQLQEVCSLLAIVSFGKTKEEIFAMLADFKTGTIYTEQNMKLFCDTYMDPEGKVKGKISDDAQLKIMIERAKEYNIIRVSHKDKQKEYWFTDTLLGYDDESVTLFLKKDDNMKRALKLQVDMKLENSGSQQEEDVIAPESKSTGAESLTAMRESLEKVRKTIDNPSGVWDIGNKAIHTVSKVDIEVAYKKYVLKQE